MQFKCVYCGASYDQQQLFEIHNLHKHPIQYVKSQNLFKPKPPKQLIPSSFRRSRIPKLSENHDQKEELISLDPNIIIKSPEMIVIDEEYFRVVDMDTDSMSNADSCGTMLLDEIHTPTIEPTQSCDLDMSIINFPGLTAASDINFSDIVNTKPHADNQTNRPDKIISANQCPKGSSCFSSANRVTVKRKWWKAKITHQRVVFQNRSVKTERAAAIRLAPLLENVLKRPRTSHNSKLHKQTSTRNTPSNKCRLTRTTERVDPTKQERNSASTTRQNRATSWKKAQNHKSNKTPIKVWDCSPRRGLLEFPRSPISVIMSAAPVECYIHDSVPLCSKAYSHIDSCHFRGSCKEAHPRCPQGDLCSVEPLRCPYDHDLYCRLCEQGLS